MPRFSSALPVLLLACCTLLLVACGSDTPDSESPTPAPERSTPAADISGNRGEGTLVLDGVTYDFVVRACDFSGESDDALQTLSGRGTTPDGEQFDVFASRNDVGGMLSHSVSFYLTEDPVGTNVEAQRVRSDGNWISVRGGPGEPLIQIDGNTLTASGRFGATDDLDGAVEGHLTATCD